MTLPPDEHLMSEPGLTGRPRICLAASGGGHVRQLLDLAPAWTGVDHFFVTEDTALGRSLSGRVHFVPHFALGQGRLGKPGRMILNALRNLLRAAQIILAERPDLVITTGAGSMFFVVVWARLLGARIVVIESFARFEGLSAFARAAGRLADQRIVQSERLTAYWPDALVFDPLRVSEGNFPPKEPILFATVGATLPFPRLVESVEALTLQGEISEEVIVQRGVGAEAPRSIRSFESAPFHEMLATMRRANVVVCHGGTGSLITALQAGCHVIAMPRRFSLGEHYDDHQLEIVSAFADRGLIQVANSEEQLLIAIRNLPGRNRKMATSDYAELAAHLQSIIFTLCVKRRRR
jgi:UDP-N-acetylglucosamine transferase subunit ALG13